MKNAMFVTKFGRHYRIDGGPFSQWDERSIGVNLAGGQVESRRPPTVQMDWPDFGVPVEEDVRNLLRLVIPWILSGQEVYVGCLGGLGRTGTFLALIAKAFGYRDPVGYVRKTYRGSAVETAAQEAFVRGFSVREFRGTIRRKALRNFLADRC